MRRSALTAVRWTPALAALATLTACAQGGASGQVSTAPGLDNAPFPAATGAPGARGAGPGRTAPATALSSKQTDAAAAARAVVDDYAGAVVGGLTDPAHTALGYYDKTTVGSELIERRNVTASARAQGHRATGTIAVDAVTTVSADLTNTPSSHPPVVPHVVLQGCWDTSRFDLVDQAGRSIRSPGTPRRPITLHVYNYRYPDTTGWRVARAEIAKGETC